MKKLLAKLRGTHLGPKRVDILCVKARASRERWWAVTLPMRRTLIDLSLRNVVHLHHLGEPRVDGAYERYVQQATGGYEEPLSEKSCPLLTRAYTHDGLFRLFRL